MRRDKKDEKGSTLDVCRIQGYVGVKPRAKDKLSEVGFAFLRKHTDKTEPETLLFVGNIPEPRWRPEIQRERYVPVDVQERIRKVLKLMLPCVTDIGEIFGTGNGRLATRMGVKGGEKMIDKILARPQDYLYGEYWSELHEDAEKESPVARWLKEYEEARDDRKVLEWSNATMKSFEMREKKRAEAKERMKVEAAKPDADGFVTVTSGNRQMKAAEAKTLLTGGKKEKGRYKSKSGRNRKMLLDASKGIEKAGFYRWQRQNQNAVADLQKRFLEDKKRMAAIRALDGKSYEKGDGEEEMADVGQE